MSELKWDSEKIRKHLRAVSGLYDTQLRKNNMDPNKMRHLFHSFFTKKYEILKPNVKLKNELKLIENEYKNYVLYDLKKTTIEYIDGWTDPHEEEIYLFIGEKLDGDFVIRDIVHDITSAVYHIEDVSNWWIHSETKADFVDITFKGLIIDICEHWSFEKVLKYMRSTEYPAISQ